MKLAAPRSWRQETTVGLPQPGANPLRRNPRRLLILVLASAALVAGVIAAVVAARGGNNGSPRDVALRTRNTSTGAMVVTGSGMTIYIYLPDPTNPPQSACTADCANDWPPVLASVTTPVVDGISRARVGVLTRQDGSRQLTLNGYPLYRYAADLRPGDVRGESVGNTWFAVDPAGNFLALPPVGFNRAGQVGHQPLQGIATSAGDVLADSNGQTVYAYNDDTATSSACTASWCVQDWPPLLIASAPSSISGVHAPVGLLRRPDGTSQLTLAGHPLYRFSGDQRPGDVRGLGIGSDWFPVAPDGSKVVRAG